MENIYNALTVAKYVVAKCNEQGYTISNLKLQKVLYFIQAQFLVATGEPCFSDNIEAWDFGPVIPKVYYWYLAYGSASIPYLYENYSCPFTSSFHKKMVDKMIEKCGKYSSATLVQITTQQTPWKNAWEKYKHSERIEIISHKSLTDYFKN
jgi:uncharacterized phage-associated protein